MKNLLDVPPLTGLNAPQGVLAPRILVDAADLESDETLVGAVVDYVNRLQDEARLVPGEYPEEASWSYCADYYLAQVNNGGHGQYAHNSRMRSRGLRDCRLGLQAMGATDNLAIFDTFLAIMSEDDARAHAIIERSGFGEIDPEISDLDDKFFQLEYKILELNAAWLKTLPSLSPLPHDELDAAFAAIRDANPLAQQRQDAANEAQAKFESEDETYSAAHACSAQEGVTFERLTAGTELGDAGIEWGALTSGGVRYLRVIYGSHAEWRGQDRTLKALHFYATRGPYRQEVGDGAVRADVMKRKNFTRQASLSELAEFAALPLAEFSFTSASNNSAAMSLLSIAAKADVFHYMPRDAWPGFRRGRDHAEFRLTVANTLWDIAVPTVRTVHPHLLDHDNTALTFMYGAGALAALGAASLRLLSASQLAALEDESAADLMRERENVARQLLEIREWWKMSLWRLAHAIESAPENKNVFLRPSAYELARRLLLKKDNSPAADIAASLAFFDGEYPPLPLRGRNDAILRSALSTLAAQEITILTTIPALKAIAADTATAKSDMRPTYRIATPAQVNIKSRFPVLAVITGTDPKTLAHLGALGVEIDDRGKRRTFNPQGK